MCTTPSARNRAWTKPGHLAWCCPQEKAAIPHGSAFPLTFDSHGGDTTSAFDSEQRSSIYIPISLPHYVSVHRRHSGEALGLFCEFFEIGFAMNGRHPPRVAGAPPSHLGLSCHPQPLDALTNNELHGSPQWKQGNGHLSHLHHVVLGLEEVYRLVDIPSGSAHLPRYTLLTTLFNRLSVSPALGVNSSQLVSSSKHSSVLVCQSPRRTPSAHGTRRLAFLTAKLAIYVLYGFCVYLVTILCEGSSPRVSEVRSKSVSDTLNHVYIHTMLFPLYSPRLYPHRIITVVTSFNYHHVLSLFARLTSYSSSWGHTL